jgi:hypothetical protein
MANPEQSRLEEDAAKRKHWRRWGPYLSERQWGTVREDYSPEGTAWEYLTHDMARSYAYRWGEDGLAGFSDNHQRLCFCLALWNGKDPFLKERLFGLSNPQGNHGEDVKECYWYIDGTPTHSYMRFLYRYPHQRFPYDDLLWENGRRDRSRPEYELIDTGVFDDNQYFDVTVEYAKAAVEDVLIRIRVRNCGDEAATIHIIPTVWFRNTWTWSKEAPRPRLSVYDQSPDTVEAVHPTLGKRYVRAGGNPQWFFTENETNTERLFGAPNRTPYVKDGFHEFIVNGKDGVVVPNGGTKCCTWHQATLKHDETKCVRLRIKDAVTDLDVEGPAFESVFAIRKADADQFYNEVLGPNLPEERKMIARQALAGMLWSKQRFYFVVDEWLRGDETMPPPPPKHRNIRNARWRHLYNDDVLSTPDKWEYPWYSMWDSAFHCVALATVDPELAKRQLSRFTREWYMHPNGQLPAYEWDFSHVNPPVHAWAAWRVYCIDRDRGGKADIRFLESVFHKLLMNFTWWVNRKDAKGLNVFEGGFMGMDNIGVFNPHEPLPFGGRLEQSDSTSWTAMYSLNMLAIAWELAKTNPAYEEMASKFFQHFVSIADAIYNVEGAGHSLWDDEDGFFYDHVHFDDGRREPVRIRSMVGFVPLLAVEILDASEIDQFPGFRKRMEWFLENRTAITQRIVWQMEANGARRCLLSLLSPGQLKRVLARMLDPGEFLSDYGIRSLSKYHQEHPYVVEAGRHSGTVAYEPAESTSGVFGGNSNWRGPVWFPVNYLLIEALRRYHKFWGDALKIRFPTGSEHEADLEEAARLVAQRLVALFEKRNGKMPALGRWQRFQTEPSWNNMLLFHEYFHGDTGAGLGASHQTGWTALVASLIQELG